MNDNFKTIKNVFVNSVENKFYPAEIIFSNKIEEIRRAGNSEYDWKDLKDLSTKTKIVNNLEKLNSNSGKKISGNWNIVIPGAIDPHVHFDTPGYEFRDDFEHGTRAAAFGGVTTIIDMPCTSLPPVTSKENFEIKLKAVKDRSLIDFAFWGGIRRNDFEEFRDIEKQIKELDELGVVGYKTYLISGMKTFKDLKLENMRQVANYIKHTGKPQSVHAEDKFLVESRRLEFQSNNRNEWRHYCLSRDAIAEEKAIKDMIEIAKISGHRIHIVHLSSELGLNAIKKAQDDGVNITSETCPHYLHFTQDDFENDKIRNYLKTAPPVKKIKDQKALWQGIADDILSFVTTDHAGCNPDDEKIEDNFWKVYGGIPGVEHRVPYMFSEGFNKGRLKFDQTVKLLSTNVADYFNLKSKGKLEKGYDADFALLNLWESEKVSSANMHSKGKYTPYHGIEFNAIVEKTFVRGKVVMDRNGMAEEKIGYGKFIKV